MFERFWSKVNKTEDCWLWIGAKNNTNYGYIRVGDKMKNAHRVSWEITNGPIPKDLFVLHKCDNPSCVRPDHLFLGTHQDNMTDKKSKGRAIGRPGENHHNSKFTEKDILKIRELFDSGKMREVDLCEHYNVKQSTMSAILLKRTWKHV